MSQYNGECSIKTDWKSINGESTFRGTLVRNHLSEIHIQIIGPVKPAPTKNSASYIGQYDGNEIHIELLDPPTPFNLTPLRVRRMFVNPGPMKDCGAVKTIYIPIQGLYHRIASDFDHRRERVNRCIAKARVGDLHIEIGLRSDKIMDNSSRGYLKLTSVGEGATLTALQLLRKAESIIQLLSYISGTAFELLYGAINWHHELNRKETYCFTSTSHDRFRRTALHPQQLSAESKKRMQKIIRDTIQKLASGAAPEANAHINVFVEATNTRSVSRLQNIHKFHVLVSSFEGLLHAKTMAEGPGSQGKKQTLSPLIAMRNKDYSDKFVCLLKQGLLGEFTASKKAPQLFTEFREGLVSYRNHLLHGKYLNYWEELDQDVLTHNLLPAVSAIHYYELLTYLGACYEDILPEMISVKNYVYQMRSAEISLPARDESEDGALKFSLVATITQSEDLPE